MGRITSDIGLITGVPITQTVDQLMQIAARPRDLIASRTERLQVEQLAISELTAVVLGVELSVDRLGEEVLFQQVSIGSSHPELLNAAATDVASPGSFQFTPVRQASSHQALSSGFTSDSEPIGAGDFSFRFGGAVDEGIDLAHLNDGQGVRRGKIRITDRSGETAEIDLSFALTVDDVLDAINTNDEINVTATADGSHFRLTDNTGETANNLRVQEVGLGNTAADLGLLGIDSDQSIANGADVYRLHDDLGISNLNDGLGLTFFDGISELTVDFRDGTDLFIDFNATSQPAGFASVTTNADDPQAALIFTAKTLGGEFDDVQISFENNGSVTQGNETVLYDSENKKLVFQIDEGNTTADDIINALNSNSDVRQLFSVVAADPVHSDEGVISSSDSGITTGGAARELKNELTLGDVLGTINSAASNRLKVEIAESGDHLVFTDLTQDNGGEFKIDGFLGGPLADELGVTQAQGDTITTGRLLSGLKSSLLKNFAGGDGLELGELKITDRSGANATVDLSSAHTIHDVLNTINNAGLGIQATINAARNGISIQDTTGQTASNLIIANSTDDTETATKLKIEIDDAVTIIDSGGLDHQSVGFNTSLKDFNHGEDFDLGLIRITDANGASNTLDLSAEDADIQTVGDVIQAINDLAVQIEARINDSGDGIILIDQSDGAGQIRVEDVFGTSASSLLIAGTGSKVDLDGNGEQSIIDGSKNIMISLGEEDTLADLVQKINDLDVGVSASTLNDGSGNTPFRLSLVTQRTGKSSSLIYDTTNVNFTVDETVKGQDALLLFGSAENAATAVLASSSTNQFDNLIDNLSIDVKGAGTETVTLNIEKTDQSIVPLVTQFVDAYNTMRDKLDEVTAFDEVTTATGVLFGSNEALRVDTDISRLFSGRFFGVGIDSVAQSGGNRNFR